MGEHEDEVHCQEWLKGFDRWHEETEAVIRERLAQAKDSSRSGIDTTEMFLIQGYGL
jgi:hypothetical protein